MVVWYPPQRHSATTPICMNIVIIGTAHPFRGGLASFNERLAAEFQTQGDTVQIYTFTLQYPNIVFPGKTQYSNSPAPTHLSIQATINSINPFSWVRTGKLIGNSQPDLVICPYWLPFMSPALSTILKGIRKRSNCKILSLVHNMIPHEPRFGDRQLSQYFVNQVDAFVTLSKSVKEDVQQFSQNQPIAYIPHPIYDNYGPIETKVTAREYLGLPINERYILFFGFIRQYKGLDLLIRAMANPAIKDHHIKLIIAGEYYGDQPYYEGLMKELGVEDAIIKKTEFIPNEEVRYYFSAADLVVQPYKTATQSGISQLCYHFEKPMVVTNVGGLSEIVPDGKAGYVVEVEEAAIAQAIHTFYKENKERSFIKNIQELKKQFGWDKMVVGMKKLTVEQTTYAENSQSYQSSH